VIPSHRSGASYPIQPQVAVGAVVIKNNHVLLVRRGKPPAQNQWAIPGGAVNLGETLQQAAEREILEETGVTVRAGAPLYTFDVIRHDAHRRIQFHYVIIDLLAEYIEGEPVAGDDAKDAQWVSPKQLKTLDVNEKTRRLLKKQFDFGA
jgi:ADP-ribose pyrophosphatase